MLNVWRSPKQVAERVVEGVVISSHPHVRVNSLLPQKSFLSQTTHPSRYLRITAAAAFAKRFFISHGAVHADAVALKMKLRDIMVFLPAVVTVIRNSQNV